MKIIFLDIDGVLNCVTTKERIPGSKLLLGMEDIKIRYLKEIVDRTDAKIVLTSTWKVDWFKDDKAIKVFLAGTIDNGESNNW